MLTLDSLRNNHLASESNLYIFSDGPIEEKNRAQVENVKKYLKTIDGFKSVQIFESEQNKGLADSIISGVTQVLRLYDRVIVLEDDLVTTPNFLDFMNQALTVYQNEPYIQSISGYSLHIKNISRDVYFQQRPGSWGWGTWKDRWNPEIFNKEQIRAEINENSYLLKQFKQACGNDISRMLLDSINNKNDSWYVRWAFDQFCKGHYTVFPKFSYTRNIGYTADGTHCKTINPYTSVLTDGDILDVKLIPFQYPNVEITKKFLHFFTLRYKITIRLQLLKNIKGWITLYADIKSKLKH